MPPAGWSDDLMCYKLRSNWFQIFDEAYATQHHQWLSFDAINYEQIVTRRRNKWLENRLNDSIWSHIDPNRFGFFLENFVVSSPWSWNLIASVSHSHASPPPSSWSCDKSIDVFIGMIGFLCVRLKQLNGIRKNVINWNRTSKICFASHSGPSLQTEKKKVFFSSSEENSHCHINYHTHARRTRTKRRDKRESVSRFFIMILRINSCNVRRPFCFSVFSFRFHCRYVDITSTTTKAVAVAEEDEGNKKRFHFVTLTRSRVQFSSFGWARWMGMLIMFA